jgi:hypothetical protein
MHEIITIQLGLESNFLATHFWNAQVNLRDVGEAEMLTQPGGVLPAYSG